MTSALIVLAFCALEAFLSWRLLRTEFLSLTFSGVFLDAMLLGVSVKLLLIFRCLRERVVIGVATVRGFLGLITMFIPGLVNPFAPAIRLGIFLLWALALLIALSMLIDSTRTPKPNVEVMEIDVQTKPRVILVLAIVITLFVVGALIYFVPLR